MIITPGLTAASVWNAAITAEILEHGLGDRDKLDVVSAVIK